MNYIRIKENEWEKIEKIFKEKDVKISYLEDKNKYYIDTIDVLMNENIELKEELENLNKTLCSKENSIIHIQKKLSNINYTIEQAILKIQKNRYVDKKASDLQNK